MLLHNGKFILFTLKYFARSRRAAITIKIVWPRVTLTPYDVNEGCLNEYLFMKRTESTHQHYGD